MVDINVHYHPKLQLFISCRKLVDLDTFSKSDPFVEVYEKLSNESKFRSLGKTEIIWDNLNPDFIKNFTIDFHFEETRFLLFKVYDADDEHARVENSDFIGEAQCTVNEIVAAPGQQLIKTLRLPNNNASRGNIIVRVEEMAESKEKAVLWITGQNLEDHSGWFRSYKPFFYLSRAMENGTFQRIYSSEFITNRNPNWKYFELPVQVLCNNDYSRPVCVELYDHHSNGNHTFVARGEFTLKQITEEGKRNIDLIDPKKVKKRGYRNSGIIIIKQLDIIREHSFIDYIAGGCQISLITAIDFTASNRDPMDPSSLHYVRPQGFNDYEKALFPVGEILLTYDSDKMVPMYGFGGKVGGMVSHCFPLTFDNSRPEVYGLEGMMGAYRTALNNVVLSGPTLFSKVIERAVIQAESAQVGQGNQQYYVLLIITDGEIHDMRETIDWIVRGSHAPLSIVIVGVGKENFTNMVRLDADEEPLIDTRGNKMQRDIVQFVPFREVDNSPTRLAKEVLDEIPREIVNFFKKRGIVPNPPLPPRLDRTNTYPNPDLPRPGTQDPNFARADTGAYGYAPPANLGTYNDGSLSSRSPAPSQYPYNAPPTYLDGSSTAKSTFNTNPAEQGQYAYNPPPGVYYTGPPGAHANPAVNYPPGQYPQYGSYNPMTTSLGSHLVKQHIPRQY
jgi:hypothetical protein